ncbi:hypothetical protein HUG17_10625 [Dermatophagoides farinae]|uniref:Ephrin RBD domain-containing protein n=1 Tax=Dermatophagoides farinae TaxID=6954 RepID=A0A9D4NZ33_DERFA|nr:hypothetical protein HUG17_10625 [Dermatophagoides farinae]
MANEVIFRFTHLFRIDNTDHIIDVNRGNAAFEYDQINIICPMYTKGTREDDIETYIIYNVSKEEYDGCHIANAALARTIAVCDKPFLNRYYTVTFRPFTPQPGGLEFHPGQDYYFIALSAKPGDVSNHCQKYHMKVVFKVCCGKQQQQQQSSQQPQSTSAAHRPSSSIVSKPEPVNNNGIVGSNSSINSTIAPISSSSSSSTSMPQSSTFSFVEFVPGHNNPNNIGIATYKGVISNGGNHNSTMFPMVVRHPKPTRSSSTISSSIVSNPNPSSSNHQSSSSYSNSNINSNNNHDNRIGHRFYGDPRGGRYSNIPHYPSLFSTERPSSHGSQINPATRIPHVPYHPYHPRQLTSTLRPVHVGWRPHPIPNHPDHNPPIRLSDQRSIGYKGIYRPNDNREKSDGLNSHSTSLLRQSTLTIISIVSAICLATLTLCSSSSL